MKLDLLYEFQPKIKPWDKPHPYGQREAEQRTYDEAIAEIQFADRLGFNTCLLYTSPSPRDRQKSRMPSSA